MAKNRRLGGKNSENYFIKYFKSTKEKGIFSTVCEISQRRRPLFSLSHFSEVKAAKPSFPAINHRGYFAESQMLCSFSPKPKIFQPPLLQNLTFTLQQMTSRCKVVQRPGQGKAIHLAFSFSLCLSKPF